MNELLSVEDAWARLTTHIDWADRFWIAFVFTDDPRVIEGLGDRAQAQLSAAGREFVSLRPSGSEELDEVFETLVGGRRAGVAWVELVRHDSPSKPGSWRAAWERLMLRLNERRELLRRRWPKGGIVFATTLDRFEETPALAPDLWTIRAMALRVATLPAEVGVHVQPPEPIIEPRTPSVRSPQLARHAVERARRRGDELGLLEALVALAQADTGPESLDVAREARALAERLLQERSDDAERNRIAAALEALAETFARGSHPVPGVVPHARRALELRQAAVEVRRELAQARPDAFLSDLASALNNLGIDLKELDRREEAIAATQEALGHYRELAKARPDAFLPNLAMVLTNLGVLLSSLGRRKEANAATQEAVDLFRELAKSCPHEFLPSLAWTLHNLGADLSLLNRREEAIAATQEAVDLFRKLPDAFRPDLASALHDLGNRLSSLGRRDEAIAATEEAIDHYRELAQVNPDAFLPKLAHSLGALGTLHAEAGEYLLTRDCWIEALWTILPSFAKLPPADAAVIASVAQELHMLSQAHGVEIPHDLAAVLTRLLDGKDTPTRT